MKKSVKAATRRKAANTVGIDARVPTPIRLRTSLRDALAAAAARDGRSRSNLIEKILTEGLAKMEQEA